MGVKYTIPLKDLANVSWRADISTSLYEADPITLRSSSFVLSYDGTTDDPFGVFINSELSLGLYAQGTLDVNELQKAGIKDFVITLYRDGNIYWTGYIQPNGIQRPFKAVPYAVTITATDGLDLLETIPYNHNNLPGTTGDTTRCPMNYIRQILFSSNNLGLPLPIRWTNQIQNVAYAGDVFTGLVSWATDGEGFYSYQDSKPARDCYYILYGILQSMQCRIYQADGRWVIRRIPNIVNGSNVPYKEIPADLGIMNVQSGTENMIKLIGRTGYRFINENQIMTVSPGVKSCKVTYAADVRENILPNGNQDLTILGGYPLFWGSYGDLGIEADISLDGRSGNSIKLSNFDPDNDAYYALYASGSEKYTLGLPIDTKTLIKRINFGFLFSPKAGFPYNVDTGIIDWTSNPFKIQVVFNLGSSRYFLNEFGYWTTTETYISITIGSLKIDDVGKVDFDKFQGILMPEPPVQPTTGYVSDIKVLFVVEPGQSYLVDNIYFNIEESNDVYESILPASKNTGIDERTLNISSSFGGYMLSNFMNSWNKSDEEYEFTDGAVYSGSLTGLTANAIMRFRYLSSDIYNGDMDVRNDPWSIDKIYLIDTLQSSRFMPLNARYDIEKCQVSLVAIECRNDDVNLEEKFYSSNDKQLSN